jgi:hypothetical protein
LEAVAAQGKFYLAAEEAVCAAQQAAGRAALQRLRGAPADPPVAAADHTVTVGGDGDCVSVGAPQLRSAGKAFFEVTLLALPEGCLPQFGWAGAAFATSTELSGEGVGDDVHSWGVDGARSLKWHGGEETAFDTEWAAGDVLGFAADPEAGLAMSGTAILTPPCIFH